MMASDSPDFVETTLGRWSSHPANLRKQRVRLLILGLLPILVVAVLCVLVYKDLFNWKAFVEQTGALVYAMFFSLGFLMTLNVLYLASFTIGSKRGKLKNRDELIFPPWLLLVFCFFWLLPYGFSLLPDIPLLKKLAQRYPDWTFLQFEYKLNIKVILNMMSVCPFLCILTWILCAKEEELKKNEKLVRRRWVLSAALTCLGALVASFFVPKYRLALWIVLLPLSLILLTLWCFWKKKVNCAKEEELKKNEKPVRRRWLLIAALVCLGALAASFFAPKYRLPLGIVLSLSTLTLLAIWWFWKKKVDLDKNSEEAERKGALPEQAEYVIKNLPKEGIRYENDGKMQQLKEYSDRIPEDASTFPLIALMNGKVPTADQAEFLEKFSSSYEDTLNKFFESGKPNSDQTMPDIILQGVDGSGRTEALCAAAVYAAVVRGQNVLYIVQDVDYASSLADKMKARLQDLLVDCYYTADYLKPNFVNAWLKGKDNASSQTGTGSAQQPQTDKDEETDAPELPPNILFATPELVELSFFNNSNLASAKKRERLRNIMLSYSVIMADDFFEMPIPQQAHLAFIFDKFRLLQASEYILGQFVVATCPLQDPYGIEGLAQRLFGLRFNTTRNAIVLRPRQCEPFWCGTLRISRGVDEKKAAQELLDICTKKNYKTLFYSKGISQQDAEELEKDFERKGTVSVSSRLYQLNEEKMPFDTIFYLSLTSGNAAAALRLSLPDDKAGTPVFFRIALEDEAEQTVMKQFALLPNETALSLRAYHLRSVLPFLPKLTPIQASVWSHFGISLTHPFCRPTEKIAQMPDGLAVKWYYDYYTEPTRYGKDVIWPYLVLATDSTVWNLGQEVDFNILPCTKDTILHDKRQKDLRGDVLTFVAQEKDKNDSVPSSQLADWRDSRGISIGTTDLAHSDLLTLITAEKHFAVKHIKPVDEEESGNAARFAMKIDTKPKQWLSHDIPIRSFSWNLPLTLKEQKQFPITDMARYPDSKTASFFIRFDKDFTNPISAEINGLMNPLGQVRTFSGSNEATGKYVYDAFMSCLVFLPEATNWDGKSIYSFLSEKKNNWSTSDSEFSSPLTHAFSIALRNRMASLSFFAMTPVFLIEGLEGSFGSLLLWILEPRNSGRTVYPLLAGELLTDPRFMKDLLKDILSILVHDKQYVTLEGIRKLSRMAFIGEKEEWEKKITRGLEVIRQLPDAAELEMDTEVQAERPQNSDEEIKIPREEFIDAKKKLTETDKQYQEFDSAVTAQLMDFKEVVDVSHFCRDYGWSTEKMLDVYNDFLWNSPEIFFVSKSHHAHWTTNPDGTIDSFQITNLLYSIRKEEYDQVKRILDQETAKAKKLLERVDDPVKKALILHDFIVRICEYDMEAANKNDISPLARTAYSVLVRHLAVCEGYTMAYRYLLETCAGIRSEEVLSEKMNHCWNYLYLNGNWYHVDVTGDDPVYQGRKPDHTDISHEFFLLSDAKITAKGHHDWSVRGLPPAADTQFDNKVWKSC